MTDSPTRDGLPVRIDPEQRRKVEDLLKESFADDVIEVEEFEERLTRVNRAGSEAELREIIADLPRASEALVPSGDQRQHMPPIPEHAGAKRTTPPTQPEGQVRPRQLVVAFWSGAERSGTWSPAREMTAVAFMGGVKLDFRDARMPPGVTEVNAIAMMGGVEIIVPPDLPIEVAGVGIMGGFGSSGDVLEIPDPKRPLLRISGAAIMGGVEVEGRYPGESGREAKRRRRRDRRLGSGD